MVSSIQMLMAAMLSRQISHQTYSLVLVVSQSYMWEHTYVLTWESNDIDNPVAYRVTTGRHFTLHLKTGHRGAGFGMFAQNGDQNFTNTLKSDPHHLNTHIQNIQFLKGLISDPH